MNPHTVEHELDEEGYRLLEGSKAAETGLGRRDQHPETQMYDLRQMAAQRSDQITQEYTDRISGTMARRLASTN